MALQHVVSLLVCSWALAWRSHLLAGLAQLLVLPAHVAAQTAIASTNIGTAATAWLTNPTTATAPMNGLAGLCGKARILPSDIIAPPFPSADLVAHNECMVAGADEGAASASAHGAHARACRYAGATEPSAILYQHGLFIWKL